MNPLQNSLKLNHNNACGKLILALLDAGNTRDQLTSTPAFSHERLPLAR